MPATPGAESEPTLKAIRRAGRIDGGFPMAHAGGETAETRVV